MGPTVLIYDPYLFSCPEMLMVAQRGSGDSRATSAMDTGFHSVSRRIRVLWVYKKYCEYAFSRAGKSYNPSTSCVALRTETGCCVLQSHVARVWLP